MNSSNQSTDSIIFMVGELRHFFANFVWLLLLYGTQAVCRGIHRLFIYSTSFNWCSMFGRNATRLPPTSWVWFRCKQLANPTRGQRSIFYFILVLIFSHTVTEWGAKISNDIDISGRRLVQRYQNLCVPQENSSWFIRLHGETDWVYWNFE